MSNHFHLLCEVPQARELSEAELLDRIEASYGPARRQTLDQELAHLHQGPDGADLRIQRPLCPMVQPPPWSLWVLWADRFKSDLIEGGETLATVAAYIELNPARAGLCAYPKD